MHPGQENNNGQLRTERQTPLQRFGLFFYDRRESVILLWIALVLFGAISYGVLMKRQGFPAVDVPVGLVSGTYFVDDSARVDRDIVRPASEVIGRLPEVETVDARSGDNFFLIEVWFNDGTSSASGTAKVRQAIESGGVLPPQAAADYRPIDGTKYVDEFDMLVSVYQPAGRLNIRQLEERAAAASENLAGAAGVSEARVLRHYESGINPLTGEQAVTRRHFERLSLREDGRTSSYRAVSIGIQAEAGQDAIGLLAGVEDRLREMETSGQYDDVEIRIAAAFAEDIKAQISSLERSLLEGLAAVLLVSFVLISFGASLTSAISMVTVMAITLGILHATGNTLNIVTLFALILSLGLIVDDTTIKVEAIEAGKRTSRRKRDIIALAAKRVSLASVAGTFTTVLAFAPMLFVSGILGEFIRIMPVTVIISLAVSLFVSLTLVPILSSSIILRGWPRESMNPVHRAEQLLSGGLAWLIRAGHRSRRRLVISGAVALLISLAFVVYSVPFFQKLKFDIFPSTKDTDTLRVSLNFPEGISIDRAETTAARADVLIGDTLTGNLERVSYRHSGTPLSAAATIDLVSYKERQPTSPELVARLERAFTGFRGAEVKVNQIDAGPPEEDLPFGVQVITENRQAGLAVAQDIAAYLRNREIERPNGTTALIDQAAVAAPNQISRLDGRQNVEVRAGFDATDTSALVTVAQADVEDTFDSARLARYGLDNDALVFDFGSESDNQESFKTMLIAFPVLLLAMYLLMALQFGSLLQPLLIFSAVPYSFFGVAAGLYATDNPLSFFVLVGFFALIGIAVNNTILLTDFANQERKTGKGRIDAIASALQARFRPLLTTSLTTVVALIPLALSDPFWESLSYTLIFGLLSSTFLVVVTFPYVYLAGEALRIIGSELWLRRLPKPVQYPLDLLIAPVRLADAIVHQIFRAPPREKRRLH